MKNFDGPRPGFIDPRKTGADMRHPSSCGLSGRVHLLDSSRSDLAWTEEQA
jgi:hypothetical protein